MTSTNLLVIILDTSTVWWGQQSMKNSDLTFTKCVDHIITFCCSHLMLNQNNKICLIAAHCKKSKFLFPRSDPHIDSDAKNYISGIYEDFSELSDTIREVVMDLILNDTSGQLHNDSVFAGAISTALCYINKFSIEKHLTDDFLARILVIKGSDDHPSQYMNFMSAVFTAQKLNVALDACILGADSNLLKQACDILGGIYLKIPQLNGFLQYLLCIFLSEVSSRPKFILPPQVPGVHRAACFCHRTPIDIGYVCSVCLSIFCSFTPICSTCQTAFKVQVPQKLLKKKQKK